MHDHGLDADGILAHVTVHWLTGTAGSAIRIYAEQARETPAERRAPVPLGVAQFPGDLPSIRVFTEHRRNLVSWNEYDRGGHYAAQEVPELWAGDVRRFFAKLR